MSDLISRDAVIGWFRCYGHTDEPIPFETLVSDLRDAIPSVDAAPMKRGTWIRVVVGDCCYRCSNCLFIRDAYLIDNANFCPNRGCDMRGADNE